MNEQPVTFTDACATVWKTLSTINVNEHTEKKGNLTYLSWAWAYATIMEHYPNFDYVFHPNKKHPDGSCTVSCDVEVQEAGYRIRKSMWLPVMDHRNKAVVNPDARAISDAKMRCLTKAISMLGLGNYIYAGEDLPEAPKQDAVTDLRAQKPSKPKNTPQAPPPDSPADMSGEQPADNDLIIVSDEDAEIAAKLLINTAGMHKDSMQSLAEFWRKNKKVIDLLDTRFNGQYQMVKAEFTKYRNAIEKKEKANA